MQVQKLKCCQSKKTSCLHPFSKNIGYVSTKIKIRAFQQTIYQPQQLKIDLDTSQNS